MGVPLMAYSTDPVYTQVSQRLRSKYGIRLSEHIDTMNVVHRTVQQGFWFTPKDHQRLTAELLATGAFQHDDRSDFFHAAAASATQGEGYREIADTSIHCQISSVTVNMHIDFTGFMWRGPGGQVLIGPNAPYHIIGELYWPELVRWIAGKNRVVGNIVARANPIFPNLANRFLPQIGLQYDITRGRTADLSKQWSLTLDLRWGCHGYTCQRTESYGGLSFDLKF